MDIDAIPLNALATLIAETRAKAEAHATALSHLHGRLRELEQEMFDRQEPPTDWE